MWRHQLLEVVVVEQFTHRNRFLRAGPGKVQNHFQSDLGHVELVPMALWGILAFQNSISALLSPWLKGSLFFVVTSRMMDKWV
jgi:hypothetical protein